MNEEFENNSGIDTELQVRLMNLVMGEASDFERDQLQAMMEQRPELVAYYQHLEHLHGLLCEVGAGEPSIDSESDLSDGQWRLPTDSREKLLAVLDSPKVSSSIEVNEPAISVRLANSFGTRMKLYLTHRWLSGLAVAAASLLIGVLIYPRDRYGKQNLSEGSGSPSFIGGANRSLYFDSTESIPSDRAGSSSALGRRLDESRVELESIKAQLGETHMARGSSLAAASSLPTPYYLMDGVEYSSNAPITSAPNASTPIVAAVPSRRAELPPAAPVPASPESNSPSVDRFGRGRQNASAARDYYFGDPGASTVDSPKSGKQESGKQATNGVANLGGVGGSTGGLPGGDMGGGKPGSMSGEGMGGPGMLSELDKSLGAQGSNRSKGRSVGAGDSPEVLSQGLLRSGVDEFQNASRAEADVKELADSNSNYFRYQSRGQSLGPAGTSIDNLATELGQSGQAQPLQESDFVETFAFQVESASPNQSQFGIEAGANTPNAGSVQSWAIETPANGRADSNSNFADFGSSASLGLPLKAYAIPDVDGESHEVAVVPVPGSGSVDQPFTVTVPDGGSMSLGGIQLNRSEDNVNRLYKNNSIGTDTSTLMLSVTPRIIVPEEEEVRLGVVDADLPMVSESELNASERRLKMLDEKVVSENSPTTALPRIEVRRGEATQLSEAEPQPGRVNLNTVQDPGLLDDLYGANETQLNLYSPELAAIVPESAPVNYPSAEQWLELTKRRSVQAGTQIQARGLERIPGAVDSKDSGLLGDVQFEEGALREEVLLKGNQQDVQSALKAIEQIKQQAQQESGFEKAKRAIDAKADSKNPQSEANTEWYKKQVGGFQAANAEGVVPTEQLAELKKRIEVQENESLNRGGQASKGIADNAKQGLYNIQNGPIDAADFDADDFNTQFLSIGNSSDQSGSAKTFLDASKDVLFDAALLPQLQPAESSGPDNNVVGKESKFAPSPEAIDSVRGRFDSPSVTAKPAEVKLAEADTLREKVRESTVEAPKKEDKASIKGKEISPKPAAPQAEKLHRIAPKSRNLEVPKPQSLDEQLASKDAFSTFSLHVSDVSFKLAQAALSQGQWPEAAKIRVEEFVNALDYRDPLPCGNERVACRLEQAIHPFLIQRNMLRVSMRTAATGRSQNTPLRLTILLDNSGSMERPDRRQAVLRAFQTLTSQLKATDQVTLISFANTPRLLADKIAGNQGETLLQLIESLPSEGGTNIESALMLAREKAAEQQLAGAQNRIVLLTDGAVNLGNANPESLAKLVTGLRDSGIAFDAAGISAHELNDEVLEALTRQGDGRYYLLDSAQSANETFAAQIAGALRPSAQNVKVQVEFNPQRVGRYKLLGYEKHRLNKEDFRNDKVDAAEMAAAEAGVAVYQFEIKPNGSGDVGSVSVRFRDLATGKMVENRWPIPYEASAPRLEQAEPTMKLAASAALLAAKLGGGPLGDSVDLAQLQELLTNLPEQVASQPRVQQLRAMIDQASAIGR